MKKGYINCNIWQNTATAFATSDEYIIKVGRKSQRPVRITCKEK